MASNLLEGNNLLSALTNVSVNFSKLGELLGITPENRGTFWKNLIELLKGQGSPLDGEDSTNSTNGEPLTNTEKSIFDFISYYCDLNDKDTENEVYLSYIFDALKQIYRDTEGETTPENSFWNYSVQEMVNHYMKYYSSEYDHSDDPLIAGVKYTQRHLKNANAGLSFKDTNWVEPNFNVNDKTYDQVRGHDEVNDILANAHKMQFTHTRLQEDIEGKGGYNSDELTDSTYAEPNKDNANNEALNKWIRLLMPQYGRRVEIEDLDRNFWVIAQVIAALSGFLFDDESPLTDMFKHLLNEIIQLWENVMYLWVEAAAISQKFSTTARIIKIPVPNSIEEPYRKFDNFSYEYNTSTNDYNIQAVKITNNTVLYVADDTEYTAADVSDHNSTYRINLNQHLTEAEIKERVEFLKDKYIDDNLIIIPFERLRNYKHNWYGCEYYQYIFTYHRGSNTWKTYYLRTYNDENYVIGLPISLAPITYGSNNNFFDLFNGLYFYERIYGIREDRNSYSYQYLAPLSINEHEDLKEDTRFYGNLRTEIVINEDDYELTSGELNLLNLEVHVYDANYEMIKGSEREIHVFYGSISSKSNSDNSYIMFSSTRRSNLLNTSIETISYTDIKKALYMGETVSYYQTISPETIEIKDIGTKEIPGYNQTVSPSDYSGGNSNIWTSADEIGDHAWTNNNGSKEYNDVEQISLKYIETHDPTNDEDIYAVKIIYPLGGQQGFSAVASTGNDYYYYLNSDYELEEKHIDNDTWDIFQGLMSHGLYVKSELLGIDKFFNDYKITRSHYVGSGTITNVENSGLYLFKKKDENLTKNNWAVIAIDSIVAFQNNNHVYTLMYLYIGYANNITKEYTTTGTAIDFSNEDINNYEEICGSDNFTDLKNSYGIDIFGDYLQNLNWV